MVFLMCWNVAGLSTTVNRIHDSYGSTGNSSKGQNAKAITKKKNGAGAAQCHALAAYLDRHGSPDILCLQEHKIPRAQLSSRSEPRNCAHVEGYESFWSCCVDDKSKGMNGVATYAKKGTVLKANAFVFGDPSLDDQGRCVMTDHGKFVVFNVYVPASGGHSLRRKMHFLKSLRRKMQEQRSQHNKAVMLVGDLNISLGDLDVYWKHQVLHVNDILQQVKDASFTTTDDTTTQQQQQPSSEASSLPAWKLELANAWPTIVETMKTKKVVPTQTTNPMTGAKFDRFRLCVTMEQPTRTIYLGKHESNEDHCIWSYDFGQEGHYIDPDTDDPVLACEANVMVISVLQELMGKLAKVEWNEQTLRDIANSPDAGRSRIHPPRQWLTELLKEDDMVDTFRHFFPTAEARFTCWHQFTNTRYSNCGTRIDYTLVDRSLLPFVRQGGCLRTGKRLQSIQHHSEGGEDGMDPLTEEAALAAATARGHFQPVSFEGGGIVEATQQTLDTQFGPQHTGMIYTPPSLSDHIAVSVLLGDASTDGAEPDSTNNNCHWRADDWKRLVLDEKDSCTKRSQPQKAQKSIASFFSNTTTTNGGTIKPTTSSSMASSARTSSTTRLPQKRPATMRSFFQPKKEPSSEDRSQNIAPTSNGNQQQQAPDDDRRVKAKPSSTCTTKTTTSTLAKKKKPAAPSILNHFGKK